MNYLLIFILLLSNYVVAAPQKKDFEVYLPPSSSLLCDSLKKSRSERIIIKQRLQGLLIRNKRLLASADKRKESVIRKLERVGSEIRFKKEQNKYQIESLEERIIRKGCPGILMIRK